MSVLGVGLLTWYYAKALTRPAQAHQAAQPAHPELHALGGAEHLVGVVGPAAGEAHGLPVVAGEVLVPEEQEVHEVTISRQFAHGHPRVG